MFVFPMFVAQIVCSSTMAELPDRLVEKALLHQKAARSTYATSSSAFSISTDPSHDRHCRVAKPTKTKVVTAVQTRINEARHKPRSERKHTKSSQPKLLTESLLQFSPPSGTRDLQEMATHWTLYREVFP